MSSFSMTAQEDLRKLLGLTETAKASFARERVLESLGFDEMYHRIDTVTEAHEKTFRWVIEEDAEFDEATMHCNARELYTSWPTQDHGIFHIAGKLGSGKSTLMKYLADHPCTREFLSVWAGV